MYILVNHTKDWGIMEVGRFDMWQDAAREIAKGIRNVFEIEVDIDEFLSLERDYDNGDFRMNEKGCRIWFDNYTCYCESDSHTEEWLILPV
jgi:hypothetical protein